MHNFENLFFIYLSFGDRIFQVLVSALIIKGYYGVDKRILKIQSPEAQLYSSKTGPSKYLDGKCHARPVTLCAASQLRQQQGKQRRLMMG